MVGYTPFTRAMSLVLGSLLLAGCANFSNLWNQSNAPPATVASASPPATKEANTSKPQPAPALFIPDAPPSVAVALPSSEPAPTPPNIQLPDLPPPSIAAAQDVKSRPAVAPAIAPAKELPKAADLPPQQLQGPASVAAMREVAKRAAQRYAGMDSYLMRLRRREASHGKLGPEEIMLCKFRKEPCSVYMKWLGTEAHNREVVYVKGQYNNVIHTLTAAGDLPLFPAGYHLKVPLDSPLLKGRSRYPITDAGLGPIIARFGRLVDLAEKGDASEGNATYMGKVKRPEYPHELILVHQALTPRADPLLPRGGQRWWFFDPANDLPVLVITHDESGREVEYYCHDRFVLQPPLREDDFNPEKLWPQSR